PKTDWLNVGTGTVDPNEVRAAWQAAREHFVAAGHIPAEATGELEPRAMKGYAYYLFDPAHLAGAAQVDADGKGGAYLCGDSLGPPPARGGGVTALAAKRRAAFDARSAPDIMRGLVAGAGITVGGDKPWDIQVHDERAYARVLSDGTLGVGESYVEGWWDCEALDEMID